MFNDVLEHMVEPVEALATARELLSPNGVVVASIPNVRYITATDPLIFRGEWRYRDIGILDATHLRFYTCKSIQHLFIENGWEITLFKPINRRFLITDSSPRWWVKSARLGNPRLTDPFFVLEYAVQARPVR